MKLALCLGLAVTACSSGSHHTGNMPPADDVQDVDAPTDPNGSGVDPNKRVVDMTAADFQKFCEWGTALQGPQRTVNCPSGSTTTRGTSQPVATCVSSGQDFASGHPNCESTVGEYEACLEAIVAETDAQACSGSLPAACDGIATNQSTNCGGA